MQQICVRYYDSIIQLTMVISVGVICDMHKAHMMAKVNNSKLSKSVISQSVVAFSILVNFLRKHDRTIEEAVMITNDGCSDRKMLLQKLRRGCHH
jgi:hypothetical protein